MADDKATLSEQARNLPIVAQLTQALTPMVRALSDVYSLFRGSKAGKAQSDKGDKGESGEGGDGETSAGGEGKGKGSTFAKVTQALAGVVLGLTQTFIGLTGAARPFVEALNPSLLVAFGQTLRDFSATIGKALEPIVQVANTVLRDFADALTPVMLELRPVMEQLATTFGGVLATAGHLVAQALSALAPVLEIAAQLLGGITEPLRVLMVVVGGVVTALSPLIKLLAGGLGTVLSWLGQLAQGLAKVVLMTTAFVAKLLGFTGVIDGMIRAIRGGDKGASVGAAAAQNAQVTDLAGLGRELAQRAYIATTDLGKPKEDDWLSEIAGSLENIKNKDLKTIIKEAIMEAGKATVAATGEAVGYAAGGLKSAGGAVYKAARRNAFKDIAYLFGYGEGGG